MALTPQAKSLNQLPVAGRIIAAKVIEESTALAHEFEQPTPRMVIFLMQLEVFREFVDALGEKSNLNLGGSCVGFVEPIGIDDGALALGS